MRILSTVIALSVWGSASVAFTIPSWFNAPQNHVRNRLATNKHAVKISNASFVLSVRRYDGDVHDTVKESIARALAAVIVSAAMWTTPISIAGPPGYSFSGLDPSQQENHVISGMVANAKEMASGSGSRVNKNPQSLLRYGLPVNNKEVRKLQASIERIFYDTSSKRIKAASNGAKQTRTLLKQNGQRFTSTCREANTCTGIIASMNDALDPLESALSEAGKYLYGSEQERAAIDSAYAAQNTLQKQLTALEEQMIPSGYTAKVPEEYSDLPQLHGRATVEFTVKKADGSTFDVEKGKFKEAKMVMIIDGYNAPVTGGNFVQLVSNGFYNKMPIQRSDGFVVQTGNPDGEAEGYVATPSKSLGAGKHGERLIPLEISMVGDKAPFYGSTMEEEGRGGQATVLPFSSYGAMGWAREEYEPDSGSSQFFWLLFDSDLTPAGKNVLDGRYPCFGYVVQGADFLREMKVGDVITSAKVTAGFNNLVLPKES